MSSTGDTTSIKELASQLKVSDALLKKILKDFSIEAIREQNKLVLDQESVRIIKEILALRASGKKNHEIKEIFEAYKKAQPVEEPNVTAPKVENKKPLKKPEPKIKSKIVAAKKDKVAKIVDLEPKEQEAKPEQAEKIESKHQEPEVQKPQEEFQVEQSSEENDDDEASYDNLAGYMEDEDDEKENEVSSLLHKEDDGLEALDDHEHVEEANEVDEIEDKLSPRKIRRRQFSFRYIQNQITNDSKRLNYIKQKLKRGKLSVKEKLNLEESLQKRSEILSGWIHLLRWVRS
ncbi:MAG: hypothetical protein LW817_07975 [Candidatus Caenarcaniphilales bacterium]|jgi:hypothetical protein|nr:hypothetical protein [Candidatus Caenarcaniphilales bacterium]